MQQISQQLGVDQATAEQAVQTALPSMVAGMAGNSQQPEGSTAIQSALGSGGMMGGLGSILAGAAPGGDLGGMLGSILGRHKDDVHQDVEQKSGLDSAKTRKLLMILAPIVIAALAKRHSQAQQTNTPGTQPKLDDVLRKEAHRANPQGANSGGLLGKILAHVQEPRA
jgi:hypothetical protein